MTGCDHYPYCWLGFRCLLFFLCLFPFFIQDVLPLVHTISRSALPPLQESPIPIATLYRGASAKRQKLHCPHTTFLYRLRDLGFAPSIILDAGANRGDWSSCAWDCFQEASPAFLMLEGSEACREKLSESGFDFFISVLGAAPQIVEYFADGTSTGNSVLRENTHFFTDIKATKTAMRTIDSLVQQWRSSDNMLVDGPILFKLDVQGYEIEVLRGAMQTLTFVDVLLLETSIVPYNQGAPLMAKLMGFVDSIGFDVLELVERQERNGVTIQLDFGFVRKNSQYMNLTAQKAGVHV
jgi:FkbM family methyltransferase